MGAAPSLPPVLGAFLARITGRQALVALLGAALLGGIFVAGTEAAAFGARASVMPFEQYLDDSAGTILTFKVRNTGTVYGIGAVQIRRPSSAWGVAACPSAPAGWTTSRTAARCRYFSAAGSADDIMPGQTRTFTLRATTAPGSTNVTGYWSVVVSRVNHFNNPTKLASAGGMGVGLRTKIFVFEILSTVLSDTSATPGASCPLSGNAPAAGSTHNLVICGRNHSTLTHTPNAVRAFLGGTFVASHGAFSSGPVAPTASSRVLGNWADVTLSSEVASDHTVIARVGSARRRTSPYTTLSGLSIIEAAPVVTTSAGTTAYTEGGAAVVIDGALTVTDADDANLQGADVWISGGFAAGDNLLFTNQNGITGSYNAATGMLTLTGSSSVANYQTALRSVRFATPSDDPGTSRTISLQASDGTHDSNVATKGIAITPVNDAPSLAASGGSASFTEGGGAVAVDPGITVTDPDSDIAGATVSITANFSATEDQLAFTNQLGISGSYNSATGVLTLTGTASVASYQTALRSVTYNNSSNDPSTATRTVSFRVTDAGALLSNIATRNVNVAAVSDAPVVTTSPGSTPYTEGDPPVPVDPGITVTDPDSSTLVSAIVTIANFESGDELHFTDQPGISGSWDGFGTLSLTGSASVADYEFALRSIFFSTTSNNPSSTKLITFMVIDDEGLFSNTATKTITITPIDEAPTAVDDSATVLEDSAATPIDVLANDTDPDSGPKTVVAVSDPANGTAVLTPTGLTYQPDPNYCNDPPGISTDTFTYTLNGGSTATVSVTVTCVNDAPVVTTSAGNTAYTEDGAPATIDAALTVTDVDDGNLEAATVEIASGFRIGDQLLFSDQSGINGSYDSGTGVLTMTGSSSVANYQAALRSVQFEHDEDFPSTSVTIEFTVHDGGAYSNTATKVIDITPVNDAPVVDTTDTALSYAEGDGPVAVDPGLLVFDIDSANLQGATVSITASFIAAEDELAFTNQLGITGSYNDTTGVLTLSGTASVAAYQTALRSVTYENVGAPATTSTRTVSFQVTDAEGATSAPATRDITVTPPNTAPVVTTSAGNTAYTEGGAAVVVDAALTVSDTDDTDLEGATVSISAGLQAGDVLGFTDQLGITGSFNTVTGVLTLSGTATLADYQTALRSITFATTHDNPTASRTVSFVVNDGTATSNTATKSIDITPVNDAPVVTTSAGNTAYTEGGAPVVVDGSFTVTDADDTNLEGATVSITSGLQTGDQLGASLLPGITALYVGGTGVLTLTGTASVADYQGMLRSVTFATTNDNPSTSRTISFTANDGTANSNTATKQIDITAVNDGPTNTVPASVTMDEDTTFSFTGGSTISVADPDAGAGALEIDLSVTNGTLSMTTLAGLTFSVGDGTADAAMTFSGTLANINSALATLSFTPTANFPGTDPSGTAAFSITSDDQGNTGSGGALSDTDGFSITVNQVNDAPVATAKTLTTHSSIRITIGSGDTGLLKTGATDVDDPAGDLTVSATFGSITPAGATITLTDAATGTYTYDPPAGYSGAASFTYTVCDDGVPAAPMMCSAPATVSVTITGPDLWFVDDSAGAGGSGRLSEPFDSLADLPGGRGTGDRIFVYSGTYATGHTFLASEHLIGQAATGSTFDTLLGVAVPSNGTLDARPSTGGAAVNIQGTVTLANSARLQGVDIASGASTGLTGTSATSVDVSQTSVTSTTGAALVLNTVGGTLNLSSLSKNGAGTGISLTIVDANVTISAGSIQNTTDGILLSGGAGNFSYAGSLPSITTGRAVEVTGKTGGATVTLSGAMGSLASPLGGTGISLTNNGSSGGATISFTGGVNLSTGANAAFAATGGGTVVVTGATNTLTTTTATALNVSNTSVGASGLTFRSINVDGNDAAPANGILLSSTGSTAGLTVTGTGSAGSGGTIQDTSGNGIELIGTRSPSLSWMTVTSNLGNGIHGGDGTAGGLVTNATLAALVVSSNGNDSGAEDGILFQGLVGTATFSDLNVSGSARHNATVINNTGTLTSLTISGSSIHENGGTGSNGLTFVADGTATMTVNVNTTNFNKNRVSAIVGQTSSAGTLTLNVQGGTYTNNFNSIDFAHASSGNLTGTFNGATITNTNDCSGTVSPCGAQVNVFLGSAASSSAGSILRATVTNNTINNGGSDVAPIVWVHTGTPAVGHVRALITGNTITNGANRGIDVSGGGCASPAVCNATIDVIIENNTVTLASVLAFEAIALTGATGPNDTVNFCVDIENNTASSVGADGIRVRHRQLSTVRLPGYGGTAFDTAAVVAYLDGRNPATIDTITAASSSLGSGFTNTASCDAP